MPFKLNTNYSRLFIIGAFFFSFFTTTFATAADDLKAKIDDTTQQKLQLEKEIEALNSQLKDIGQQATSLTSAIKSLDATINKNALSIKLTQNNINAAVLQLERLAIEIDKNTTIINEDSKAIANLLAQTHQADHISLIENLLAYKDISEFWNEMESIYKLQNQIRQKIEETKDTKKALEDNKKETEAKKKELLTLKANLEDQKAVLQVTKKEKSKLLADTKDKESNYQKLLAEKKALAAAFDKELLDFQSQLNFIIDPSSIPAIGKGILRWPLDVIKITQKFGVTNFSQTTNAYNGKGHNGVDFGAPIGTRIKAALSGVVLGTGNTDLTCPGASFGKWVFIKHDNGLSTLYAHLSLIKVGAGDQVATGDVVGYTGNTGFSTGPHLHFGVYATQGSKIMSLKSRVCGGTYTMPVADLRAYLDPLQYL